MVIFVDGHRQEKIPALEILQPAVAYGCSLFETVKVSSNGLYRPEDHVKRLLRSVIQLDWPMPGKSPSEAKKTLLRQMFQAAQLFYSENHKNGRLRLTYLLTEGGFNVAVTVTAATKIRSTAKAAISPVSITTESEQQGLKSGNYLPYFQVRRAALQAGIDEGILLAEKRYLAEGSISNLFFIKEQALHTPCLSLGILPGITRHSIVALARNTGIRVIEGKFAPRNLLQADAAFLTNSIRGIWPISSVGAAQFNVENPLLLKVQALYSEDVAKEARWCCST